MKLRISCLFLLAFCTTLGTSSKDSAMQIKNSVGEKCMDIKTVVFDFDGTIADTLETVVEAVNELAPKYSYKPIENAEVFRGKEIRDLIKEYAGGVKFYEMPFYIHEIKKLIREKAQKASAFENIKTLIDALSQKYKIAIISSNSEENIRPFLEKEKINVDSIYSDDSIFGKHKVINNFLKDNNLKPEEIIYIGDEIRDIQACKKSNVKIIAVTWGFSSKELLEKEKPDFIVDNVLDILNILLPETNKDE